jgi:Fe-S oxidoreductase
VEVLEATGHQIVVPHQSLCCGRPLYDYGFLGQAEQLLRTILDTLHPYIEAGIPLVGLEPSCVAVFRDELTNLFPNDENAHRLSKQTFLLSEFLAKKVENYQPPRLERKAIVHGHCHHKAIMKMNDEQAILAKLGLDFQLLDSGCCGMAGAFGFEKDHYDISLKAGERVLLPTVRQADKETLIIADGFSCREQIAQTTDRQALHLAQVLHMALHADQSNLLQAYPEKDYLNTQQPLMVQYQENQLPVLLMGFGLGLAGTIVAWLWKRRS